MKRSSLSKKISDVIHERGPITVAAFMDLALYDPEFGYYACAVRRSGRGGDFITSVDVGPLFGELLEVQLAEMHRLLDSPPTFDLVEAGAGDGRLAADVLCAARRCDPVFHDAIRLHLAEASPDARGAHLTTLGDEADRLQSSAASLPPAFEGALVANELLDALPAHQVVMRHDGLREVYVALGAGTPGLEELTTIEGPLSTPDLERYLERAGTRLETGWRVEINLRAIDWIRDAGRRLRRGFVIVIDYGHEARELYSPTHASGTLTTFVDHRSCGPESSAPPWLVDPGERDITAHVDFTSIRAAARDAGLQPLGLLDQTYFLLGLLPALRRPEAALGALKTLILPGGLGSAHKVLILGKNVGVPPLSGCSYRMRVT